MSESFLLFLPISLFLSAIADITCLLPQHNQHFKKQNFNVTQSTNAKRAGDFWKSRFSTKRKHSQWDTPTNTASSSNKRGYSYTQIYIYKIQTENCSKLNLISLWLDRCISFKRQIHLAGKEIILSVANVEFFYTNFDL